MAYEHKPGSFSLFKNDKGDNEKRPDYRGDGKDVHGNDIEVSAWIRDSAKGKFMSCTYKPKGEQKPKQQTRQTQPEGEDSDACPF